MPIQGQFTRYQQRGYPGTLSRPIAPFHYDTGEAGVDVYPGAGVRYNDVTHKWVLPTTDAERLDVLGVVVFDMDAQTETLAQTPTNANSDARVQVKAGARVKIGTLGTFYAIADVALEYGDLVVFDQAKGRWIKAVAVTDLASSQKASIYAVSSAAQGEMVEIRVTGVIVK